VPASHHGGSPSIQNPDYWWYRARSRLLRTVLADYVGTPSRVLDVGSADGPSVEWLRERGRHTALDIDLRGLGPGDVCGSATAIPFRDGSFDVVAALDVIEHVESEASILAELRRVLAPGGRLLVSVPAYQWAWSDHDVANGHHRRYTRGRAVRALRASGFEVHRATYVFAAVFPMFAAERLLRRLRHRLSRRQEGAADIVAVPQPPASVERALLALCRLDERWLARRDLAVGSSVVLAAEKPVERVPAPAQLRAG
jgi:SAM-dependent methyltransferase